MRTPFKQAHSSDCECERHLSRLTLLRAVTGAATCALAVRPPFYVLRACFEGSRRLRTRPLLAPRCCLLPPGSAGSWRREIRSWPRGCDPNEIRLPRSNNKRHACRRHQAIVFRQYATAGQRSSGHVIARLKKAHAHTKMIRHHHAQKL